jgi:hypothetical protein
MKLRPLPDEVAHLLDNVDAPPRLIAHLTLVHDVASMLIAQIDMAWPSLDYDRHAVALGAAVHDIGKVMYPDELSRPGHAHEAAGEALLVERGFPREIARFARTHDQWRAEPMPLLDDLLVALADALWRGKRDPKLEDVLCQRIVAMTGDAYWQVFARLDDIATEIAVDADARLSWQE